MQKILNNRNQTRQLLHSIMEYCEDIITVKDTNLNYIACNKAFLKCAKVEKETDIIGKNIHEILTSFNANIIENYTMQVFKDLQTKSHILKVLCKENKFIYFKQTITPIVDDGKLFGVLSVAKDITNEENLQSELLKKVSQLDTLLKYLPLHVYLKDLDKNFVIGSQYAKQFSDEGYDYLANNLKLDTSKTSIIVQKEEDYVIQSKEILVNEKTAFDFQNNPHFYKTKKIPILDKDNNVIGLITMVKNIDKEKQMENQRDMFVATLTHDLKNPILAQISSLKLFNDGFFGEMNTPQKEIIETMLDSSLQMKRLLYSIMKTYKENNGVIQLNKNTFSICELLKINIKEVANLARERGLTVVLNSTIPDIETLIEADEIQIRRVIGNLLNNAISYAIEKSNIEINLFKNNKNIVCQIKNKSLPIPEVLSEHLFDKYVCNTDKTGILGIGLGLYYCKKIIEGHNGSIKYYAEKEFSIFEFQLPCTMEIVEDVVL